MESLIAVALFAAFCWWFYKAGKSEGSRKGFNVGRRRGNRRPRS